MLPDERKESAVPFLKRALGEHYRTRSNDIYFDIRPLK
jgi:hypothetical protein